MQIRWEGLVMAKLEPIRALELNTWSHQTQALTANRQAKASAFQSDAAGQRGETHI